MNETFFLEITVMIELKLYMNGHWIVPYKVDIFFMWIGHPRWPPLQDLVFNIIGKRIKDFSYTL